MLFTKLNFWSHWNGAYENARSQSMAFYRWPLSNISFISMFVIVANLCEKHWQAFSKTNTKQRERTGSKNRVHVFIPIEWLFEWKHSEMQNSIFQLNGQLSKKQSSHKLCDVVYVTFFLYSKTNRQYGDVIATKMYAPCKSKHNTKSHTGRKKGVALNPQDGEKSAKD